MNGAAAVAAGEIVKLDLTPVAGAAAVRTAAVGSIVTGADATEPTARVRPWIAQLIDAHGELAHGEPPWPAQRVRTAHTCPWRLQGSVARETTPARILPSLPCPALLPNPTHGARAHAHSLNTHLHMRSQSWHPAASGLRGPLPHRRRDLLAARSADCAAMISAIVHGSLEDASEPETLASIWFRCPCGGPGLTSVLYSLAATWYPRDVVSLRHGTVSPATRYRMRPFVHGIELGMACRIHAMPEASPSSTAPSEAHRHPLATNHKGLSRGTKGDRATPLCTNRPCLSSVWRRLSRHAAALDAVPCAHGAGVLHALRRLAAWRRMRSRPCVFCVRNWRRVRSGSRLARSHGASRRPLGADQPTPSAS